MKAERLVQAFEAGKIRGAGQIRGTLFIGASPEAEKAGFIEQAERACFITGFLQTLPRPVRTDADGKII